MEIRQGTEADILKASRLWLEMLKELAPQYKSPNIEWWRRTAENAFRRKVYFLFVADNGGKIVGFLDWFLFPEPSTGLVHAVGQHYYVMPEYRGTTVAGRLYRQTVAEAVKKGAKVFELFTFESQKPMWIDLGFNPLRTLMRKEVKEGEYV